MIDKCKHHTPCPILYIAWHEWAAVKSKTHKQIKCKDCGKLSVWVEK